MLHYVAVSEINVFSLFVNFSHFLASTCSGCAFTFTLVGVGGKEKNKHFLWGDDELAQSVMNCGEVMVIADHVNQLIRFLRSIELDTLADPEETAIIKR